MSDEWAKDDSKKDKIAKNGNLDQYARTIFLFDINKQPEHHIHSFSLYYTHSIRPHYALSSKQKYTLFGAISDFHAIAAPYSTLTLQEESLSWKISSCSSLYFLVDYTVIKFQLQLVDRIRPLYNQLVDN